MNSDYYSRAEVGIGLFPFAEVVELRRGRASNIDAHPFLPDHLRDLPNPSVEESVEIVRRLALRVARVVHGGFSGQMNDLSWFGCPDEEYDFDLSLHVAAILLAGIGLSVKATDGDGGIRISLAPSVETLRDWLLSEYVPTWHYLLTANSEDDDDFVYDLNEKVGHADEIDPPINYFFFEDNYDFVDIDSLRSQDFEGDFEFSPIVAVRKAGLSTLRPRRPFDDSGLDGVVRSLVTVLEFFHKSGSEEPFVLESIEDLRKQMEEDVADDPDFTEDVREWFDEESKAEVPYHYFWAIGAILDSIGLSTVLDRGSGEAEAVIRPPDQFRDVIVGRDYFEVDSDFFSEFDLDGSMSLGSFEYLYFVDE